MRPLLPCLLSMGLALPALAGESGGLVGVGVKRCEALTVAARGADRGEDEGVLELRRYSDWVGGFVSGLNLATGEDLLRNLQLAGAMRRVALHCADHPDEDVFTAVQTVLRGLQAPERDDSPQPGGKRPAPKR